MSEGRGKKSLMTRIWAPLTWLFSGRNPQLYSYQSSLPKLPVPSVSDTLQRYLRSMKPLLSDEEYDDMEKLAQEFQETIASRLQKYLVRVSTRLEKKSKIITSHKYLDGFHFRWLKISRYESNETSSQ